MSQRMVFARRAAFCVAVSTVFFFSFLYSSSEVESQFCGNNSTPIGVCGNTLIDCSANPDPLLACCKEPCLMQQAYTFNECEHNEECANGTCRIDRIICWLRYPQETCQLDSGRLPDCDNCRETGDPPGARFDRMDGTCVPCDCYSLGGSTGFISAPCAIGPNTISGSMNDEPLEDCCIDSQTLAGCLVDYCEGDPMGNPIETKLRPNCDCGKPCP